MRAFNQNLFLVAIMLMFIGCADKKINPIRTTFCSKTKVTIKDTGDTNFKISVKDKEIIAKYNPDDTVTIINEPNLTPEFLKCLELEIRRIEVEKKN